jgi:hypothetical protein
LTDNPTAAVLRRGIRAARNPELVESFGNPDTIEALLTEDAQWWITPTVGILGSPSVGRDQIVASMRIIFGDIYTDVSAEIHAAVGDDEIGAVRFTLRARVGERP